MAQYGAIRKVVGTGNAAWVFTPPSGSEVRDTNFLRLLNGLASLGWRVVVAGDFGNAAGDELILEKS